MRKYGHSCFLLTILWCSFLQVFGSTNDPELLQQLWNQLYRYLPGPSIAPQLPSDLSITVEMSVIIDSVELRHAHYGMVCRISFTTLSEWPVTDDRVTESRLIELIHTGVRLDATRVWHPELVVVGSQTFQRLTQRLELRTTQSTSEGVTGDSLSRADLKSAVQSSGSMRKASLFNSKDTQEDTSILSNSRRDSLKIVGKHDSLRYAFIESFAVEIPCLHPRGFSQLGAVLCPIRIRQEGAMKTQPIIKWTERKGCLLSENARQSLFHVTLSKQFGPHVDKQGPDHALSINLCFSQISRLWQYSLIPLVFTCISALLLWIYPSNVNGTTHFQLALLLLMTTLWPWISERLPHQNGFPGLLDVWCIICLVFIAIATCLAVVHAFWVSRILRQQRRRHLTRAPSASLLPSKGTGSILCPTTINNNVTNAGGCFQGCTCGSSTGTGHELCINCSTGHGRTSGSFVSPLNGPNGVYCSNSSCGASGHACGGNLVGAPGLTTANNSPAPLGYTTQSMGIGVTKMDACTEGLHYSANSDSVHGGVNGEPFRGFRWRTGPANTTHQPCNNPGVGLINLESTDCQICTCLLAPSAPQTQNHNPHSHSLAPPYTSFCSSISYNLPECFCLKVVKIAFTITFMLVSAIFWISVLSQGTVPDGCLGPSVCNTSPSVNYIK